MKSFVLVIWIGLLAIPMFAQKKRIVATTTFLADLAKNIAGEDAEVISLMPIGGDPHIYEPIPEDVEKIIQADLILRNGLTLEGWLSEMIENSGTRAPIKTLTEGITPIKSGEHIGAYDPHAWMSVRNAKIYVLNIKNALIEIDKSHQAAYEARTIAYHAQLDELDAYIRQQVSKIPEKQRLLLTSHDAFHYFGNDYGIQVKSVLGTSTDAEVRLEDMQNLVNVIRENHISAIFVESTINPKLMQQVAGDQKVKIGGKLFADSLGDVESGADTYLNMIKHNIDVIVAGLATGQGLKKEEDSVFSFILIISGIFLLTFFFVAYKLKNASLSNLMWRNYHISVRGLTVSYDKKPILSNIYLSIENGHVYGLIGGNGSGKSTLMKSILHLLTPDTGEVEINGRSIEEVRNAVAYVPQKEEIDWSFPARVIDVVKMGRYPYKKVFEPMNERDREIALGALAQMGIADLENRQIGELSGGQQQRVFLARALCQQAEIYLLDEPFVGVDITTEEKIMEIVRKLAAEGKLIVVIHHDLAKIKEYFDRLIMVNRRIVAVGDTEKVFNPENIRQTYGGSPAILDLVYHQLSHS